MKLRIGVLSPFYQNYNYGGKLQALAMIRILEQQGYSANRSVIVSLPSMGGMARLGELTALSTARITVRQFYKRYWPSVYPVLMKIWNGGGGHLTATIL